MNLADSSEDDLIKRVTSQLSQSAEVLVGPGDDCAVIRESDSYHQLLKTDCVVEGVHFLAEEDATRVGWKAIARFVSDIAAMGGVPHSCVVTIILRSDTPIAWLDALYLGMRSCASRYALSIVGGETSAAPVGSANVISIAGTGRVAPSKLTLRSGAQATDAIFVTGQLGGSIAAKHLDFSPRLNEAHWLVEHHKPTAMMDLSDGLGKDLPRLAAASSCGYLIDREKLPCSPGCSPEQALSDGEDYELLFTIPQCQKNALERNWPLRFPSLTLSCIGEMDEQISSQLTEGWDHFKTV